MLVTLGIRYLDGELDTYGPYFNRIYILVGEMANESIRISWSDKNFEEGKMGQCLKGAFFVGKSCWRK